METYEWYRTLLKPSWAPPAWIFGPVWTVLYVLISVSFGVVFWNVWRKKLQKSVAMPFALNLFCNLLFTPIQFGLKNNVLASIDILLTLGTLVWAIQTIYPKITWIAYAQIPYLLWVLFATILQLTITVINSN